MLTMKTKASVKTIIKKTTCYAIAHAQIGDIYEFTCPIQSPGSGSHGTYASYIKIKNTRNNEEGQYSFNEISRIFKIIEFEELKEQKGMGNMEKSKKVKIEIMNKNLFAVPQGYYLAHCISSDFALGAGIAKEFNDVYNMRNKLFDFYGDYCWKNKGIALLVDNVFNLVTKEFHYNKPTYESLTQALMDMKEQMKDLHISKLAIPKIGCGLDKLDWNTVYKLIEDIFNDMEVEILICTIE